MKPVSKLFLLFLAMSVSNALFAYDLDHVVVTWQQGGSTQSTSVNAAGSVNISRDPGTAINVKIYKSNTAPASNTFSYAAFTFGGTGEITSGNSYENFNNVAVAGTSYIYCMVNTMNGKVTVNVTDLPNQYPDLAPTFLTVDGHNYQTGYQFSVGQAITAECRIINYGQVTAGSSKVGFYIGTSSSDYSNRYDYESTGSLGPNGLEDEESDSYTFTTGDIGTRYLNFFADYLNTVGEGTAEGNNKQSWGAFTVVAATPQIEVTPSTAQNYGIVNIGSYLDKSFVVKNTGYGNLSGSASVSQPFSIVSGGTYTNLQHNQTQTVVVRFIPTANQYYSTILSFSGGGGSSVTVSGTGAATPVADILDISYPTGPINPNEPFILNVYMKNMGTAAAVDGGISVSFPDVTAVNTAVDPSDYESSQANVYFQSSSTLPNRTVYGNGTAIWHSNGTSMTNHYLLMEATKSSWPVNGDAVLYLMIYPKQPGDFQMKIRCWLSGTSSISRDPSSSGTGIGTDQQGYYTFDKEIIVNNAMPDLTVTAMNTPTTGTPGSTYSMTVSVLNAGNLVSPASTGELKISNDQNFDNGTWLCNMNPSSIAAGQTYTSPGFNFTIPSSGFNGNSYLLYKVDAGSLIQESDENNNVMAKPISISSSLSITVSQPSSNSTVNQGFVVPIQWNATGPDGSIVTLKYDPDTDPGNGNEFLISSGNSLTGSTNWATSNVPANSYFILGIVSSGSSNQSDYAPGQITITSQYAVTMESYRISTNNGGANTENPGTVKTQFIPGESVRITMRAKNTGSSVPVRCVLNVRGPDNSTWVYDSHALGMDNSTDSPLDPGENYDYYSFDWVIPPNAQVGYYDIGGSMRNFSNFDLLYETTSPGANSNFNGDAWILPDAFQVINGADNVPPMIEVWRVYQSGDERFRVVAKVTDAGSGVNPNSVKLIFYRLNCTFCTSEHNDMVAYPNYPGFYEGVSDQFEEGDHIIWKIEAKDHAGNIFHYPEDLNNLTVNDYQASYSDYAGRIQIHDFAHLNDANSFTYLTRPSGAVTFKMDGDDIKVKNNTAIWYEINTIPGNLTITPNPYVELHHMLKPKGGFLPLSIESLFGDEESRILNAINQSNITLNVDRKSISAIIRNSVDMIMITLAGINYFSGDQWETVIDAAVNEVGLLDYGLNLKLNNPNISYSELAVAILNKVLEDEFQSAIKEIIIETLTNNNAPPLYISEIASKISGVYEVIKGLNNRTKFIFDLFNYPEDDEQIQLGKASPLKLNEATVPGSFSYSGSQKIYTGQQANFSLTVNVPAGNIRPYVKTYAIVKLYDQSGLRIDSTKINDYGFSPNGGIIVQFDGLPDNTQGASLNPQLFNNNIGIKVVYSFINSVTGHQFKSTFKPYFIEVILYQNGLPGINVNPFEPDVEISTGKIPFRIYDNTNPQKPVIAGVSSGMDLYNFGFYLEPADPDIFYYKVYRKFPSETSFTYIDSIRNGSKERLYFCDHFTEPHTNAVYKVQAIDISDNVSTFSDEFPILITTFPPTLFHLNSPADNQGVTAQMPILSWDASTDPDGTDVTYDLYLSTNTTFTNPIIITNLAQTSYQASEPLADNTIYYWKVKAKDAINENRWSYEESWKFAVNLQNQAPESFSLTEPNQTTVGTLKPTLKWQASSDPDPFDAVKYTVLLATNSNFTNALEFANIQSTQYTLSTALSPMTTYYWKVKAVDKQNLTTWSTQTNWSFVSPPVPNALPELTWTGDQFFEFDGVYPNAGDTLTSFSYQVLYKDADNDAPLSGYPRLIILKNGIAISGSPFVLNQLDNNSFVSGRKYGYTLAPVLSGTDYTYYFEAHDIKNALATGEPVQPHVGPDVNYLKVISPNGGQSLVANQQYSISWFNRGNFEKFFIQFSANNGISWEHLNQDLNPLTDSYSWTVPVVATSTAQIKVGGVYSLDTVYDASDNVFSVSIPINAPNPFSLTSPQNTDVTTLSPMLSWNSTTDPNGTVITYELWYSTDSAFISKTVVPGLTTNQYSPSQPLTDNTRYYWKVKAIDADGLITWSTQKDWYFIVNLNNNGPNAPSLTSPANGTSLLYLFPQFSWSTVNDPDPGDTVKYELWVGNNITFATGTYQAYSNILTNSFTLLQPLSLNATWYWKVFSVDNHGSRTASIETEWWFTTPVSIPQLTVSPTIINFASTPLGIHSPYAYYDLSGTNLTSTVNISSPEGALISFDSLSNYSNFLTVFPANGTVNQKRIFIVFAPTSLGFYSDSIVNSSIGASGIKVYVNGTGNNLPVISIKGSGLSFGNVVMNACSNPQNYLVSGHNLTGNVTITAPTGFQVSTASATGFESTVTLTPISGTVSTTTIYVKFCPVLATGYNEFISHSSSGAITQQLDVSGTGIVPLVPAIAVSPGSLEFGSVPAGSNSGSQSYTVSGTNLSGNVTITAPEGFQISTSSLSGFSGSVVLVPTGGVVALITIYARFSPTSAVPYSGNITHTCSGVTTQNVAVSGTGITGLAGSCPELPSISYGGRTYNTIQIGSQCWLRENINIGSRINGVISQNNNSIIEKYCFNDLETNCDTYGGLYEWGELVQYLNGASNTTSWNPSPTGFVQGLCPSGWHIPSDPEWKKLEGTIDSQYGVGNPVWDATDFRGSDAGAKLKSMSGWYNSGNGTNASGFTCLPGGYRGTAMGFSQPGYHGYFWTSTQYSATEAVTRTLVSGYNNIRRLTSGETKNEGFSLRCLKDTCITMSSVILLVTPSANPVCAGTSVTFTATPTNGGTSPVFQWKVNDSPVSGATYATYTFIPVNNDVVTCTTISNASCITSNTATSNSITMVVGQPATAGISINASANPVAAGTEVSFQATLVNPGNSPLLQWQVNGINTGPNAPLFTYSPADNDMITCILTSSAACATNNPAISNSITMYVTGPPCAGQTFVQHGGRSYNLVEIGTQCWFKENLNIGTRIDGTSNQTDNGTSEKFCYSNLESNCDIYGGLYQWNEMMQYSVTPGAQGLCPQGWHIPTDDDWCVITNYLDLTVDCNFWGWSGTDAGGKMKETGTAHWMNPNTLATNSSGFTALPAGYRLDNGSFDYLRYNGYFYSSSEYSATEGIFRNLNYSGGEVARYYQYTVGSSKSTGFSVRCLKNISLPINQTIQNSTIQNGVTSCFNAIQTLTVAGNGSHFTIQNGGSVTMIAGQNIDILSTTLVNPGGYLHGYISTNGQFCFSQSPSLPEVFTNTANPVQLISKEVRIYPNPTTSKIIIELPSVAMESPVIINVYNSLGTMVLGSKITQTRKCEFNLEHLPTGIYLVNVLSDGQMETVKIVRQ